MANSIQLFSNLKIITSGAKPTVAELTVGQAAFGKWAKEHGGDDRYHIYGNADGVVKDLVLDTMDTVMNKFGLPEVLARNNIAENVSIVLKGMDVGYQTEDTSGGTAIMTGSRIVVKKGIYTNTIDDDEVSIIDTTNAADPARIDMSIAHGFVDKGYTVLSGNLSRTFTPEETVNMRGILDVFSKSEVKGLMTAVFDFKGTLDSLAVFPATGNKIGDVWQARDTGKLYAWVADSDAVDSGTWEILGFILDLSNYYTIEQVEALVAGTKEELMVEIEACKDRLDEAEANITNIDERVTQNTNGLEAHVTAPRMHSTNDYTDVDRAKVAYLAVKDSGTGGKILNDKGDYVDIELVVDQI